MFQAYRSMKPITTEREWLPYFGETEDAVRADVFEAGLDRWDDIFIAPIKEIHCGS
ncbi:hypothetical protein [Geobacter sp. SVR]|uniref:hypothetical protein n=1 Tax=Geobacter sp. SVR TaxID=2495594 RepID=UPI00143EF814|nr:hypothetical protein [Geobacter sp. SVR]BCS54522.1 hypothetical protein GSVR_28300 [Geobacter sp. SVR]GCF87122.1 hypothetical protein GSbR_37220 [Geobacter sp. SVR]